MTTTAAHLSARRALRCAALALALAGAVLLTAPPAGAYDWPVKPFNCQHPVRGFFGDPRILGESHSLHWGIDVSAPNGTPVYAIEAGTARYDDGGRAVLVRAPGAHELDYWHIVPAVREGQQVVRHQLLGHIEAPWAHVHLGETIGGTHVNPLRPGALAPYRDTTQPAAGRLTVERHGVTLTQRHASGRVDLVVEAWDRTPIAVPAPWDGKPVTPAIVRWRVLSTGGALGRFHVAADFKGALPACSFDAVYARWTRQNKARRQGRYRFVLTHDWDTCELADGQHRIEVVVSDTAGNTGSYVAAITVANGAVGGPLARR